MVNKEPAMPENPSLELASNADLIAELFSRELFGGVLVPFL